MKLPICRPWRIAPLVAVCLGGLLALAATYVPIQDGALVDKAPLVIVGRIDGTTTGTMEHTVYQVSVQRVLKGSLGASRISVAVLGNESVVVPGMPTFFPAQRVILFLGPHADGNFRLVDLMLGAFKERRVQDSSDTRAERDLRDSLSLAGPPSEPSRDFEGFAAWIEGRAKGRQSEQNYLRPRKDLVTDALDEFQYGAPFTLYQDPLPARWVQFDAGGTVPWLLRPSVPASTLGAGGATAFQIAMAALNNESTSNVNLSYAGINNVALGTTANNDGLNAILMNDPLNEIAGTYALATGGVLAYGSFRTTGGQHTYKGVPHRTIAEGDIVTNDGADAFFRRAFDASGPSEKPGQMVMAHELGHTLGIAHSCNGDSTAGACVPGSAQDQALMRADAHTDNRGAALTSDDVAALVQLYANPTPSPTATPTPNPTPTPTGTPTISVADASVSEGHAGPSAISFVVSLSQAAASAVNVGWRTLAGVASGANGDYAPADGVISIPAGATSTQITVLVNGDTTVEPDETFGVELRDPVGGTIARSPATGTIFNDDPAGPAGLGTPSVTAPSNGQTMLVTGVSFSWTGVGSATGYDVRVVDSTTAALRFSGSLSGAASTSTLISLPAGSYHFAVRACQGGFAATQCGTYGTVGFTVSPAGPGGAPAVTFPSQGANLTSSTQTLSWTAVTPNPALSGLTYEVLLRDLTAGTTALQITVPSPTLSTIFTMKSSTQYELKVRACQAGCGPYSTAVTFAVALPAVPTSAPTGVSCSVSGGNSLTCSWNAVANADAYQVQVVQAPPAGPGGGALTAAARQVSATTATLPVPTGAATVFIAACNGNGCGPNATSGITATGNPSQANIGTPMAGTVVAGPGVLFTWNRVPGDDGSNTKYRLFVQDLSRQATALDVLTTSNFYSAFFKAEGARYDALVVSNPGLLSQTTGPSQGFNVAGSSATSPTMVSPSHNGLLLSGNIQLGWSPVPGATLYEYFVAVLGQSSASARGVTPGLLTQVPLTGSLPGTVYSGIVRACPAGATCAAGSDTGWGPWSNAVGGPGVTNFTVVP